LHRYSFYLALVYPLILLYDASKAFTVDGHFGIGLGTIILAVNVVSALPHPMPRVVDEDAPHQLRGDAEEVAAVLPVDLALVEQPQIRLVDHRGDLQAIVAPFTIQLARGQRPQLVVDERHEAVEGLLAAVLPFVQQLCDVRRFAWVAHS
jgi:hypothetical protein